MKKPIEPTSPEAIAGAVIALTAAAWDVKGQPTARPAGRTYPSGGVWTDFLQGHRQNPHERAAPVCERGLVNAAMETSHPQVTDLHPPAIPSKIPVTSAAHPKRQQDSQPFESQISL